VVKTEIRIFQNAACGQMRMLESCTSTTHARIQPNLPINPIDVDPFDTQIIQIMTMDTEYSVAFRPVH